MRQLRFLLRKEFLQIFRDRMILGMLFAMPLVQLLLLGNAATFEVRSGRVHVVDQDRSRVSRGLVERLVVSGRFRVASASQTIMPADRAMLRRDADMILVVPTDFERDLVRERRSAVQLVLNAEDASAASVMRSYAGQIISDYAAELGAEFNPGVAAAGLRPEAAAPVRGRPVIEVRQRGWYNAELAYSDYMVPAILVVLVTIIGTLLTAMNIVREKEAGTLEQLYVTPMSKRAFLAAKLIPLWSLALVILGLGLVLACVAFDLPIRGSVLLVFLASAIYLVGALGIGLWISSVSETQQQAMFVTYSLMMVYLLMSGLFTPVSAMPDWAQVVAQFSPVMHFTELMRAVLLRGAGVMEVGKELGVLAAMATLVLGLVARR